MYESSLVVLEVGFTGRKIDIVVQIPDLIHQPLCEFITFPNEVCTSHQSRAVF